MKYLILIHQNRGAREQFASFPPEVQAAGMQAYYDLNAELTRTGEMVSAEALSDDSTATVVSLKSGSVVTSDGPFAESKEMLAGFYLVDVTSLDRAVEIAAKIPEVQAGAGDVEVRAVMDTAAMA
ncbi:MAG TPA: YciI family protein [Propionicimonas sp.]|nr:YciI family protein [Propionicimonas sp.]